MKKCLERTTSVLFATAVLIALTPRADAAGCQAPVGLTQAEESAALGNFLDRNMQAEFSKFSHSVAGMKPTSRAALLEQNLPDLMQASGARSAGDASPRKSGHGVSTDALRQAIEQIAAGK